MAGVSASDVTLDNQAADETKVVADKLFAEINADEKRVAALANEFSEDARKMRNAKRAFENAKKPETIRRLAQEARKSKCEKMTDSTPLDWGYFVLFGLVLHAITAVLFIIGLVTVLATADTDGILWAWFALELTFALLMVKGILNANKARAAREAAQAAAKLEEGQN